jgi:hypothetical protein
MRQTLQRLIYILHGAHRKYIDEPSKIAWTNRLLVFIEWDALS